LLILLLLIATPGSSVTSLVLFTSDGVSISIVDRVPSGTAPHHIYSVVTIHVAITVAVDSNSTTVTVVSDIIRKRIIRR
jgi:hypothetical protein